MKLLLDTHVFLWLSSEPERLSPSILKACQNIENRLYLSLVSPWEMQIKEQLGKLILKKNIQSLITEQMEYNHLELLKIELNHILALKFRIFCDIIANFF